MSSLDRDKRRSYIVRKDVLSMIRQSELLGVSRKVVYSNSRAPCPIPLNVLHLVDRIYTESPYFGERRIRSVLLRDHHIRTSRKMIRRTMDTLGVRAMYPQKNTSLPNREHQKYPYLLRGLNINRRNQVWGCDITYIRLKGGFVYLVAIMDWYSRKVLAWKLSTTMDTRFCTLCLEEAIFLHGKPEIFNTDQGAQFTSEEFTEALKGYEIRISMDGKGRWVDNVFTERLWRSLKQNEVYRNEYASPREAFDGISRYFQKYNSYDPHQSLGYQTPDETYYGPKNTQTFSITIPENRTQKQKVSALFQDSFVPAFVLS